MKVHTPPPIVMGVFIYGHCSIEQSTISPIKKNTQTIFLDKKVNFSLFHYIYRMYLYLFSGRGDRGSIPSRVIPKAQKMVLDAALLTTQHYKVRVKWSNPGNEVAPSPTTRCSSY